LDFGIASTIALWQKVITEHRLLWMVKKDILS